MNVIRVRQLIQGAAILCIVALSGCATIQHGGAPIPAFNLENDIKELTETFGTKASIAKYYQLKGDKTSARDEFIDGRLALYNIRYLVFIRDLGVDKQHLDAATDILLLGVGLAGTLTGGLRSKTNLAAFAALITGTKISIDKHFYFEKTVPALVATMNAQRKEVLIRIMRGRQLGTDKYPFTQALADLYDYEQAGTLIGAINIIQVDAGAKEVKADGEIRFIATRDTGFVGADVQARVKKLLGDLDTLDDVALFRLAKDPPVKNPEVDKLAVDRDPSNARFNNRDAALTILKAQLSLSNRDDNSLAAWEAALKPSPK